MGISKCSNKTLKYCNKISKNIFITLNEGVFKQISSNIINVNVINVEFLASLNSIKLLLEVNITILYSTNTSNNLLSCDRSIITVEYINLPKIVEGNLANKAFIENKIKYEIFIENISSKILSENLVILNFYMLANLNINPSFYISYVMDNGLFENVYSSFSDGENMIQNTNETSLQFKNLSWQPSKRNLFFIGFKDNYSYIYNFDFESKRTVKLLDLSTYGEITSFTFINHFNLVFSCTKNSINNLYSFNLKNNITKLLDIPLTSTSFTQPYYDTYHKKLYFLALIDNISSLCCFDLRNSCDVIFNLKNIIDFIVDGSLNKAIIKLIHDSCEKLFLLDLSTKMITPLNISLEYDCIYKVIISKSNNILILLNSHNTKILLSYDLSTFTTKTIYSHNHISDFDIDFNTNDILVSYKTNVSSEVIKISDYKSEVIVKTPSYIKSLSIRK